MSDDGRKRLVLRGYAFLDLLVLFTVACVLIEVLASTRFGLADYGAPLGLFAIFFLVPLVVLGLWILNKVRPVSLSREEKLFLLMSRLALAPMWLVSCVPVAFLVLLLQPWPLTLMHGPDTSHSVAGFQQMFGREAPESVSEIYFRADGGWGDTFYKLRFRCTDPAFAEGLIEELELERSEELYLQGRDEDPDWWRDPEQPLRGGYQHGGPPGSYWRLWFDPGSEVVYFEHWSA